MCSDRSLKSFIPSRQYPITMWTTCSESNALFIRLFSLNTCSPRTTYLRLWTSQKTQISSNKLKTKFSCGFRFCLLRIIALKRMNVNCYPEFSQCWLERCRKLSIGLLVRSHSVRPTNRPFGRPPFFCNQVILPNHVRESSCQLPGLFSLCFLLHLIQQQAISSRNRTVRRSHCFRLYRALSIQRQCRPPLEIPLMPSNTANCLVRQRLQSNSSKCFFSLLEILFRSVIERIESKCTECRQPIVCSLCYFRFYISFFAQSFVIPFLLAYKWGTYTLYIRERGANMECEH